MRRAINRIVLLIVDALDDVSLLAHAGVRKNGIGGGKILQVGFERADVNGGAARNIFAEVERGRDFLHGIEAGELADAHAHGVARMNQAIGARLNAAVSAVGISRRPISRAFDFARLNRAIADGRAGQKSVGEGERVNERFESGADLAIGRRERAIEFALRIIAATDQRECRRWRCRSRRPRLRDRAWKNLRRFPAADNSL